VKAIWILPKSADWEAGYVLRLVGVTVGQALISACLSGLVGTGGAFFYSELRLPLRRLFWKFSFVCFSLPTVLVALTLISWFGKVFAMVGGEPYWFSGWIAIFVAHTFLNFPLFVRTVGNRLLLMDRNPEKVALSLGASRFQTFRWVTWKRIRPSVSAAFFLSFLYCSSSFILLLLLGGGPRFTTLEVAIYRAIRVDLDIELAVRFAFIQWLISLVVFFLAGRGEQQNTAEIGSGEFFSIYRFRNSRSNAWVWFGYLLCLSLFTLAPLLNLLMSAASGLAQVDVASVASAFWKSAVLAAAVGLLTSVIVFPLVRFHHLKPRSRLLEWLYHSPSAVSTLVLTLSWWVTYPLVLQQRMGNVVAVGLIQSLMAFPLIYRIITDGFSLLALRHYQTARTLGASPGQIFWWVELPSLKSTLILAWVAGAVFSLGEVTSLLLFAPTDFETLTFGIYRRMARYEFGEAYVMGALLLMGMIGLLQWGSYWDTKTHDA